MVWNINAMPEALREIASSIDNDETIERASKDGKGDGKIDDIEMQALFNYCKNNVPEFANYQTLADFTSIFDYKPSVGDWILDSGGTFLHKQGCTYNLNPVRTLIGPENDSDFSKAARVMDPGLTTGLDNVFKDKKTKNTAMWVLNPIGKAISSIFG